MTSLHKYLFPFLFTLLSSSNAYNFNIGNKDGWTLHPSESYNQWSGRLRFIVNDTLHFKYDGGLDSVMEVKKDDYDKCDTSSPISTLTGGDSVFVLNRPGPFYFISGNKSNCDAGQKLSVVVISPKKKQTPPGGGDSSSPPTGSPVGVGGGLLSPTGGPAGSPERGGFWSPMGGPAASPGGGVANARAGGGRGRGTRSGGAGVVTGTGFGTRGAGAGSGTSGAIVITTASVRFSVLFWVLMFGLWIC